MRVIPGFASVVAAACLVTGPLQAAYQYANAGLDYSVEGLHSGLTETPPEELIDDFSDPQFRREYDLHRNDSCQTLKNRFDHIRNAIKSSEINAGGPRHLDEAALRDLKAALSAIRHLLIEKGCPGLN
jgi:hypothetical protein